ncbi:MAG: SRPBCC family protein [Chloroflexi bacterium]|nr:SRPBCC family protein [Chloroflexota bacterium]
MSTNCAAPNTAVSAHRIRLSQGPLHVIERTQTVGLPLEHAFVYFSDPRNVPAITPPSLAFRVQDFTVDRIARGVEIGYAIRWLGIPVRWTTLIPVCDPPHSFVDTQVRGPYRFWWHEHLFEPVAGGTRMTDRITYALPFGLPGRILHALVVRGQLQHILDHRTAAIARRFPLDP